MPKPSIDHEPNIALLAKILDSQRSVEPVPYSLAVRICGSKESWQHSRRSFGFKNLADAHQSFYPSTKMLVFGFFEPHQKVVQKESRLCLQRIDLQTSK
mmetsp:Transcript_24963/g.51884  ORF Transcript_24963/g.51884 Transcript_24963/m.51884 type:complete len:99 (+) Transcript_24963:2-298(+)